MSMLVPNVEELVSEGHAYRQLIKVTDWSELSKPLGNLYSKNGRKGYSVEQGFKILFLQFLEARGLHSMAIKKNNAKNKNRDLDRFFSSLRMPFEGVFSKMSKRARYRGKMKVHFQVVFEALIHNLKRLIAINAQHIALIPI